MKKNKLKNRKLKIKLENQKNWDDYIKLVKLEKTKLFVEFLDCIDSAEETLKIL